MISHKYRCIFIHIAKCAGSSIEKAFGIDLGNLGQENNKNLFGWDPDNKLYLQHATPQQLLNTGHISYHIWNSYYKFIVVRNPWDRALSDYYWMMRKNSIKDSFNNFLLKKGLFEKILTDNATPEYRGDHLNKQKDYFFIDGNEVKYDTIVYFERINEGLSKVCKDLGLSMDFFKEKVNVSKKRFSHYSKFYDKKKRELVLSLYGEDVNYLNYKYEERKNLFEKIVLEMFG